MTEVTRILSGIGNGDPAASADLLPLVYRELRALAKAKLSYESAGQSLQPTALVHEAYLRLVDTNHSQVWNSRGHFFAAAAQAMRRILIENARRKQTLRRGGDKRHIDYTQLDLSDPNSDEFLTALDRALESLSEENPVVARVVDLRFFAGLSIQETASSLDLSLRTINRHWAFAKAWLFRELSDAAKDGRSKKST